MIDNSCDKKSLEFSKIHIALYVTCLVDLIRPKIAWAALNILTSMGCKVSIPKAQTCCGQPAYNSGVNNETQNLARNVIQEFMQFDYTVLPSRSADIEQTLLLRVHGPQSLDIVIINNELK
tara:strand:+ start:130 stop:492 length:363 start_codon:yes stop_codon:yes gene_type:complete